MPQIVNNIKHFFLLVGFTIVLFPTFAQKKSKVVVFDIKEEIAPAATRITTKALVYAKENNADLVVVHMNTFGGLVSDADSIRTQLLNYPKPVVVFIDNNAASAGALISIACDKIYMRDGANIGAATVVNQTGEAAPDKYQSYMRSIMRSTAEAHGKDTLISESGDTTFVYHRDPQIAESMVDPRTIVPGLIDSTKVLTMTASEAMENGYCEGIAQTVDEVIKREGYADYEKIHIEKDVTDKLIGFFSHPGVSSVLVLIMLGGLYFELQTPGVGFPILASAIAAVLYFVPLYMDGLAENWEIGIAVLGVLLIILEIFVIPGFGVAGISGMILLISGLILSLIRNVNFDFSMTDSSAVAQAFTVVFASIGGFIVVLLIFGNRFLNSPVFRKLVLSQTLENARVGTPKLSSNAEVILPKKGDKTTAYTSIKPTGKIIWEGELYDAKSWSDFIDKDDKVEIVTKEGRYYIVRLCS